MSNGDAAHYELRDELVDALRADLLGPFGGPTELLTTDAPITTYPVGVLYPQQGVDEDHAGAEDGNDAQDQRGRSAQEDDRGDLGVSFANQRRPSSMGMTFAVDTAIASRVVVHVEAARYVPEDDQGRPIGKARHAVARTTEQQVEQWRRTELLIEPQMIDVTVPGRRDPEGLLHDDLQLRVQVRAPSPGGTVVSVTVTLVNTALLKRGQLADAAAYFQPVMRIAAANAGARPFVERPGPLVCDEERALSRLLYRHAPDFAVGHGCSAHWDWTPPPVTVAPDGPNAVAELRTEFLPTHEVLLTDSNREIDVTALGMRALATGATEEVSSSLHRLVDQYERWIGEREREAASLQGTEFAEVALGQVKACKKASRRMRAGVGLLEKDPNALKAFQYANEAMAAQRAQGLWIKSGRAGAPPLDEGHWRPFQISFMLLCLDGIADSGHADRDIADLLWFPTGGGKTEAYLGLIAFTTFLRRLRDPQNGGGVTVFMRYTLRLLTLQQFERASALICAMELIRHEHEADLGIEPVSIGMWVGASATPNTLDDANDALTELRRDANRSLAKKNPVQLHRCPWCGQRSITVLTRWRAPLIG